MDIRGLADVDHTRANMAAALTRVFREEQIYAGTASPHAVARRRARNKRAGAARRAARKAQR